MIDSSPQRVCGFPLSALLLLVSLVSVPSVASAAFMAGAAKVNIDPKPGVSLDGPISKNGVVKTIHDPLHARALVLDDGDDRIAIVIVDNCITGRDVFDAAKKRIQKATGLAIDRMLMAATHTHAAPRTSHISRDPIDDEYHQIVSEGISQAVQAAIRNLAPAKMGYSSFNRPDLIACRRFRCEPGTIGPNPFGETGEEIKSVAGRSTGVIGPAGPVDPQFSIMSVRHADGTPLCVLGNFSVHYCGGYQAGAVSADYFGFFSHEIESLLDHDTSHPPVLGMMSNGTSGNTGAFQRSDGRKFAAFEGMQHYGRMLADETVKQITGIEYRDDVSIGMLQRELTLAVRRPDEERMAWVAKTIAQPVEEHPHRWSLNYAKEAEHLSQYPAEKTIVLQAIRIGDVGIAAAPCEVFAETGLAIKSASQHEHTFTIELANGYGGYLPTSEQHELGGYETWPARSSHLEINAETKIRSTLSEMLEEVRREP